MSATRRTALRAASLLTLAFAAGAHAQTSAPAARKKHRLLIAVSDNDPAKWNMVMNNVKNAQEDVGADKIDIEVVAYGPGINMIKSGSPVDTHVAELVKSGVKVVGCENTMKVLKLEKSQMLTTVGYVPAAVTEIMKKQEEGWSYVRP
jgi:uncharacterized protein